MNSTASCSNIKKNTKLKFAPAKCCICLNNVNYKSESVVKLACSHWFHLNCILINMTKSDQYDTCPLCRNQFETPDFIAEMENKSKFINTENRQLKDSLEQLYEEVRQMERRGYQSDEDQPPRDHLQAELDNIRTQNLEYINRIQGLEQEIREIRENSALKIEENEIQSALLLGNYQAELDNMREEFNNLKIGQN